MTQYNETVNSWKRTAGTALAGLVGLVIGVSAIRGCANSIENSKWNPFEKIYGALAEKDNYQTDSAQDKRRYE